MAETKENWKIPSLLAIKAHFEELTQTLVIKGRAKKKKKSLYTFSQSQRYLFNLILIQNRDRHSAPKVLNCRKAMDPFRLYAMRGASWLFVMAMQMNMRSRSQDSWSYKLICNVLSQDIGLIHGSFNYFSNFIAIRLKRIDQNI